MVIMMRRKWVISIVARVKDKGIAELRAFRARVLRQAALNRISRNDADWIVERIDDVEARVILMDEKPELEREMF